MKKRTLLVIGTCAAALLLSGCTKKLSNDYVTISAYKGIEVEQVARHEVTDQDVEDQIEYEMDAQGESVEVTDRAAQIGDTVNIDYEGKKDGVAFDGGTAQGADLELGSNTFIDGFEDGIVGHSIGETFDLQLTFPENYGNTDLAGQDVVFTVKLNSITGKIPAELTEEYIRSATDDAASTLDEYRAYLKEDMQNTYDDYLAANLRENAWTAVLKNTEVKDYPEDQIKELSDNYRRTYENMAETYNMEFEDFLSTYLNMDEASFENQLKSTVKDEVKQNLVADLIIENEQVDVSEEALEKAYAKLASQQGIEAEDLKASAEASGNQAYLDSQARIHLAKQWLADHCKPVIDD